MAEEIIIDQLQRRFLGKDFFSRQELYAFYTRFKPNLKESTFRWIIYNLKEKQIISSISRGLFTLNFKPVFKPNFNKAIKHISIDIEKHFPTLKFCVWTTQIVSEFMLHVPSKHITVLQVEKEAIEPVYDFLRSSIKQRFDIFIQPSEKEIERYIYESEKAIVVIPLITKSPVQSVGKIKTITLEKLIVDLFADKKLFVTFQGSELSHIVNNAYHRYEIDFTKLFHYAKRRGKDSELREFFRTKTDIPGNILND